MKWLRKAVLFGLVIAIVILATGCVDKPTTSPVPLEANIDVTYNVPNGIEATTYSWTGYRFGQVLRFDLRNTGENKSNSLYMTATAYATNDIELGEDYTNTVGLEPGQAKRMEVAFYDVEEIVRIDVTCTT